MKTRPLPFALLTFAQSSDSSEAELKYLEEEKKLLTRIFVRMKQAERVDLLWEKNLTNELISERLADFPGEVRILHFGGHANGERLSLEDGRSYARGLAESIRLSQPGLRLLFLNGCSTLGQAEGYLRAGVQVVIATTSSIRDDHAVLFANRFYELLEGGASIRQAFERASAFLLQLEGEGSAIDRLIVPFRGAGFEEEEEEDATPWRLFYQEDREPALHWTIPPALQYPHLLTSLPGPGARQLLLGREAEMQSLYENLGVAAVESPAPERNSALTTAPRLCLQGMGGIGKTALAMGFLQAYGGRFNHLAWLTQLAAEKEITEKPAAKDQEIRTGRLEEAFTTHLELIEHLKLKEVAEANPQALFPEILRRMAELPPPCLLVIDNFEWVDSREEQLLRILAALPRQWHVLLTSRQRVPDEAFKLLEVGFLEPDPAGELFKRHYYRKLPAPDQDEALIKNALEAVDSHTLTIELVAKMGKSRKIKLPRLVDILREKRARVDDRADIKGVQHHGQRRIKKVFSYLREMFSVADLDEPEQWLLQQFIALPSFFHSYDLLEDLLRPEELPEALAERFPLLPHGLSSLGWLLEDEENDTYKLHPVLQDVLASKIPPQVEDVTPLFASVTSRLTIDQTRDNPIDKFPWVPFGESLLNVFSGHDSTEINLLQNELALVYSQLGRFAEARDLLEAALQSDLQNFGENHPNVAVRQSNLANVYRNLGDYARARDLLEAALQSALQNFGENHPNVAVSQSNLANVYSDLGDYARARDLLEAALQSALQNFGENHPNVAVRQSNLANVYRNLGDYARARDLLEAALQSDLQNFGENHPNVAVRQSNLANVYSDLGDYARARDLLEAALQSDLQNFGENHPNVAVRQSNLANVYSDLGDYARARDLLEAALQSALQNFGENHPNVAVRQSNLANVYSDLGDYARARDLLEAALQSALQNFGENHPNVAVRQSNLANVYSDLGDYARARDLLEAALQSALQNFGENHPNVAVRQSNLANVYSDLGDYARARDLLEAALQSALQNFGENHPNVAVSQSNLANVYRNLGDYARARDLLEAALQSALQNFGENHPNVAVSQLNLASVYFGEEKYSEALPLFLKAYQLFQQHFGDDHPHTQTAGNWLGAVLQKLAPDGDVEGFLRQYMEKGADEV